MPQEKTARFSMGVFAGVTFCLSGLYIIGEGSGITQSLSHASASGVHVARTITEA